MTDRKQGVNGSYQNLYPNSNYDPTVFERPTFSVDVCAFRMFKNRLQVLLINRGREPFKGLLAFPGGFVDIENLESPDDAAKRELQEETGIKNLEGQLKQFKTYASGTRDPRWYMVSIAYYYIMTEAEELIEFTAGDDASNVQWYDLDDVKGKLAFDHEQILNDLTQPTQASEFW